MISGSLWAGVRVHVVAGYDVHSHIRPRHFLLPSTSGRHGRLAAAIVEQVEIRIAEVAVGNAVDNVVEAGLGQAQPGGAVEHFIVDVAGRGREGNRADDAERQPEEHESQEAVKVASHQREIRLVRHTWLKARLTHELFGVDDDAKVDEQGDDKWEEHESS